MRWGIAFIVLSFALSGLGATPALPGVELSENELSSLVKLRTRQLLAEAPGEAEKHYQILAQKQTFSDLQKIYSDQYRSQLKITYAAFTQSDSDNPGDDLGFGLHVVKRLELPLPEGGHRTIEVNEHWPEDRRNGSLLLPDEIRIKSQVFHGQRKVRGSQNLYLFDSIRLAWGPANEVLILRSTTRDENGQLRQLRVPVAAPFSCQGCHSNGSTFAVPFLKPGEKRNYEAIVQDSHFEVPLRETKGFKEYLAFLEARSVDEQFKQRAVQKLLSPRDSLGLAVLAAELRAPGTHRAYYWAGQDAYLGKDLTYAHTYPNYIHSGFEQGVYRTANGYYLDFTEEVFWGKYLWWEPTRVIP